MAVRILCVEDNPQNMRLVRKILNSQGYEVLEAEDGFSGLNMAETENPDLILMDVNLPDIDGLEVTRRIKAQSHLKPIPIVALTANAMFGDEERCLEAGCDGYIAKPVSKNKLLAHLETYLDSSIGVDSDPESASLSQSTEESLTSQAGIEPENDVKPVVELEKANTDNGSNEHRPNTSAFRNANRRHQFRKSATSSNANPVNEDNITSDN